MKKPIQRPRKPQPTVFKTRENQKTYYVEIILTIVLVIYFAYYYIGKNTNVDIVTNYARHVYTTIFKSFKTGNLESKTPVGIMSVSNNNFVIECYDHPLVKGACLYFNLIKRQDFFTHMFQLFTNEHDELVIDVVFKPNVSPPCIFSVCSKPAERKIRKEYKELQEFCKVRNGSKLKLADNFTVISDAFDTTELLPVITDIVFGLANNIQKVKIDSYQLEKCKKVRAAIAEQETKKQQKKARQEYVEKQEELKYRKINAMSPEERHKYEEKQRNKQLRKKQVKVKMG
ncbi:Coiled-coil domain-containing protein 47 [Entamoeba marina]